MVRKGNPTCVLYELGIIGIKYMIRMRTIIDTYDSNNEEENVI